MRRLTFVIAVSATLGAAVVANLSAQSKPNFSGTWTLLPEPNGVGGRAGPVGRGFEFTVVHTEKTLAVTMNKARPDSENPGGKTVYGLDGSESRSEDNGWVTKVKWDGNKLVITSTSPDQTKIQTETWSLVSSDRLMIELTNYALANPNKVGIYKKG